MGRHPPLTKRYIARGREPSARKAVRSGKRGCGNGSPQPAKRPIYTVVSRLHDNSRAQRNAGLWERRPPPAKRLVARSSEPCARQAECSGKRERGAGSLQLPSTSLPAVASRLQEKPCATENGTVGAAASTYQALRTPRQRAVCKKKRAQRKAGVWERQPPPAKRPADTVASRLQDKPSAAESGAVGATAPSCQALRCPR